MVEYATLFGSSARARLVLQLKIRVTHCYGLCGIFVIMAMSRCTWLEPARFFRGQGAWNGTKQAPRPSASPVFTGLCPVKTPPPLLGYSGASLKNRAQSILLVTLPFSLPPYSGGSVPGVLLKNPSAPF